MTPETLEKAEKDMKVMLTYSATHTFVGLYIFLPFSVFLAWNVALSFGFETFFYSLIVTPLLLLFIVLNPLINNNVSIPFVSPSFIRYVQTFAGHLALGAVMSAFALAYMGKL